MQAGFHDRSRVDYRLKGPGGYKGVKLVICKCKDIRTVFQICHQCIRAVALALRLFEELSRERRALSGK